MGLRPTAPRVVSATNIDEMHRPGIALEPAALFPFDVQTDTVALNYCMGWLSETYRDGRQLLWHSGGIDGFAALMGFFPAEQIGFAFLTNMGRGGGLFNLSLQASLLGRLFGLNGIYRASLPAPYRCWRHVQPSWPRRPAPSIQRRSGSTWGCTRRGSGCGWTMPGPFIWTTIFARCHCWRYRDGSYVVAAGPDVVLEQPVTFEMDADKVPVMTITGFAPVRWLTGG